MVNTKKLPETTKIHLFCLNTEATAYCVLKVSDLNKVPSMPGTRDSNKGVATAQDVSCFFCEYLP